MARRSSFQVVLAEITTEIETQAKDMFRVDELDELFESNRALWKLPASWYTSRFISSLESEGLLFPVEVQFHKRKSLRYGWRKPPGPADFALALHRGAYLAYYSALAYHQLTDQQPKTIYVSIEQSDKRQYGQKSLTQEGIDNAFKKTQRPTANLGDYPNGYRIARINPAYSGRVGVVRLASGRTVTNLERTLLDATVRPAYSGGVDEVLEAYRRAAPLLSVNKLVATLRKLDYTYPHHQAIGFYLELSGQYSEAQLERLYSFPRAFDFYLSHAMQDVAYSKKWRLYYPAYWS